MEEQTDKQTKNSKPWQWKPGQSGNPAGRPKGQSLKEYARQWFNAMGDLEKKAFLEKLDPAIVWRMAEGNPAEEKKLGITGTIATAQLNQTQVDKINQVIFDDWDNEQAGQSNDTAA